MITERVWEKLQPLVQSALDHQDEYDFDAVKREVICNRAQVWQGESSVNITQLNQHVDCKKCRIWLAAGDMTELVERMLPEVEKWAKAEECGGITIVGRKGWVKKLKSKGFSEPPLAMLEKEI